MAREDSAGRWSTGTPAPAGDRRAHRRDPQRLRRGRPALRPVVRGDRRALGPRHLDRRDHPGGDPAPGAQRRGRERQPHPPRVAPDDERRRRGRPGRRVQRAAPDRARPGRGAPPRLHDPPRVDVAHAPRPVGRRVVCHRLRRTRRARLPRRRGADGRRVPEDRERPAARQEHVRARDAVRHLRPRHRPRARAGRAHLREEGRQGHRGERAAPRGGTGMGRGAPRAPVRDRLRPRDRAADGDEREHRARARDPRVRHGRLRDVPDHARDLGFAGSPRAPSRSAPRTRGAAR